MPSLGGITVRILCDELPLEEYSSSVAAVNASAVTCWIANTRDKSFSVHYQFDPREGCGWSCNFYCDGVLMRSALVKPETLSMKHNKARNGDTVYPVRFAEVAVTDSQDADTSEVNHHLGTIKITIQRVEEGWTRTKHERSMTPSRKRLIMDDSPLHESKKSLIGHRIKLGHAMPSENKDAYDIQVLDPDEIPYRTFIFYYRPKAVLQALGHAPPSTSISVKRSWYTLSDSEQDAKPELEREEEEIQAQLDALWQKKEEIMARRREAKRLKKEEFEITVPASSKGEVIDLCSD